MLTFPFSSVWSASTLLFTTGKTPGRSTPHTVTTPVPLSPYRKNLIPCSQTHGTKPVSVADLGKENRKKRVSVFPAGTPSQLSVFKRRERLF